MTMKHGGNMRKMATNALIYTNYSALEAEDFLRTLLGLGKAPKSNQKNTRG